MLKNLRLRYRNSPPFDRALFIAFIAISFIILISFSLSKLGIWEDAFKIGVVLMPFLLVTIGIIYYKLVTSLLK